MIFGSVAVGAQGSKAPMFLAFLKGQRVELVGS